MTPEEQLYQALSDARLSAYSVWPDVAEDQAVPPYIIFSEVSRGDNYTLGGLSTLLHVNYQIDVYAKDRGTASGISDAVESVIYDRLDGILVGRQSIYEKETKFRRSLMEFSIRFVV